MPVTPKRGEHRILIDTAPILRSPGEPYAEIISGRYYSIFGKEQKMAHLPSAVLTTQVCLTITNFGACLILAF